MTDRWRTWLDRLAPRLSIRRDMLRRLLRSWRPAPAPPPAAVTFVLTCPDAPREAVMASVDAVLAQTRSDWAVALVPSAEASPAIRRLLRRYVRLDARITSPAGVREAIEAARSDYVCWIDAAGTCAHDLLEAFAGAAVRDPSAEVIYTDQDRLEDEPGPSGHPWFKPDWSPELMRSVNLLEAAAVRRPIALAAITAGAAVPEEFAARVAALATRVVHIPRVLVHCRRAAPWPESAPRTRWPAPAVRVSVVIPTRDRSDLLRVCVRSILEKNRDADVEIVVVDTGSVDAATFEHYAELQGDARIRVLFDRRGEFNYSGANNLGARAASGDLLLFLNNDTEGLDEGWIAELAGWVAQPGVGVAGAKLLRPGGLIQHAGIVMGLAGHGSHVFEDCPEGSDGPFGSSEWVRNYQAVTGACLMTRRSVFDALGGFDEIYQVCYSDIDFCLRARAAGHRVVYTPFARVRHHEGASRGHHVPAADVMRASLQMLPVVAGGDPYFNPNLSYQHRQPAIAAAGEASPVANVGRVLEGYGFIPAGDSARLDPRLPALATPEPWPAGAGWLADAGAARVQGASLLLLSHDLSLSGAPLLLVRLARRLRAAGYSLTVAAAEDGPARELYRSLSVPIVVEPSLGHLMVNVLPLTGLVASHDLVLANTIVNWRAVHLARAFGKPSVLWIHESQYGRELTQAHWPAGAAVTTAGHVVLPARRLLDLYGPLLRPGRFTVLPYGIDDDTLDHGEEPSGLSSSSSPGRMRIVHIGSLEPRKGQDVLLAAFTTLPPELRERVELTFIGRPLRKDFTAALVSAADGLPNVHFAGALDPAACLGQLRRAEIFVLSSADEVLPVSMLEAMAFGKAVVTTDVGGITEAIEPGVNGLVVPAGDPGRLAVALAMLIEDAALRARLGQRAQATFRERYTGEQFARGFLPIVEQALADPRPAPPAAEPLRGSV